MVRIYYKNWEWTHDVEEDERLRSEGWIVRYVSPGEYKWRRQQALAQAGLPEGSVVEVTGGLE